MSAQILQMPSAALSPTNELASAVLEIMRLTGLGPYSAQHVQWWERIVKGQPDAVEAYWHLSIEQICSCLDVTAHLAAGTSLATWSASVMEEAVLTVAKLLDSITSTIEHPTTVRQHLAAAGLSPEQAAQRLLKSLPAMTQLTAKRASQLTLSTTCAPVWECGQYAWLQHSNEYKDALQLVRPTNAASVGALGIYPVTTGTWRVIVKAVNVVLSAPVRCKRLEVDVTNRFWPEASIKIIGVMLAHPTASAIDRLVLKTIALGAPGIDAAILATQGYLEEQAFDGIAGPVFMVEALEKTLHMDTTELALAFTAALQGIYSVCNVPTKKLGTLVWNTVPAPWVKAPQPQSIPKEVMHRYCQAKHKIDRAAAAISHAVRKVEGNTSMASLNLKWARSC